MLDAPATDTPAFLEEPAGERGGWPVPHDSEPAPAVKLEKPAMLAKASEDIGKKIHDIAAGHSSGEHPALDRLVGPQSPSWPDTVCRPDCPHRTQPKQPQEGQRIVDVYPSLPERVYGLERDMHNMRHEVRQHRDDSIRNGALVATKESVTELERNVYTELDNLNRRVSRRTAFQVLQTVALIVSAAYGLILSYKHFITQ